MTDESVLHLPYRYRLAINMLAIINSMFGRDIRMTALLTLQRGEIEDAAEGDAGRFEALADAVGYVLIAHRKSAPLRGLKWGRHYAGTSQWGLTGLGRSIRCLGWRDRLASELGTRRRTASSQKGGPNSLGGQSWGRESCSKGHDCSAAIWVGSARRSGWRGSVAA
ncbi:hypothetical protein [Bradyrhizobium sp. CB2312]|uniref:hypothetical protein n=1 Tax=Bradyrhizobium sp. CB2312 TaxID=3039155 RepID=UPI0024B16BB4|nr:hypothetical protein [Bradyrhizobium sp. CB2312]WFU75507.1 hypothetical protein QA642_16595 [Bradyrhizobium sp. CB2312]